MKILITHFMTLLAFVAHVVGGCCAHHVHGMDLVYVHQVQTTSCCSSHSGHRHQHYPVKAAQPVSDADGEATPPCSHEHSEQDCKFILTGTPVLQLQQVCWPSPVLLIETHSESLCRFINEPQNLLWTSATTHASRCALLQLWVI